MFSQFNLEEKNLLLEYINYLAFPKRKTNAEPNIIEGIQFIIRPECNQSCEYCYIYQHGKDLYPIEERIDNKQILKNLDASLDFIYNQKDLMVKEIEFFAGDLLYDKLICDILDLLYKYLKASFLRWPHYYYHKENVIIIPTNFHGIVQNDELYKELQDWVVKFNEIHMPLCFSCSTDGKYAVSAREKQEFSDEYWDEYFERAFQLNAGYHPMISAETIENASKNYDWWAEKLNYVYYIKHKYEKPFYKPRIPFMLEVRNDNWTEEKIDCYIQFLDHIIQHRLAFFNNDIEAFTKHLYCRKSLDDREFPDYDLIKIKLLDGFNGESMGCGEQRQISINIQNMTLIPCHRLSYKQFIGGKFLVNDNNKIYDVEPYNVSQYLNMKYFKIQTLPKCNCCDIKHFCMRGCLGSQYEYVGEPFYPIPCVCELFKRKTEFLIKTYYDLGVFEEAIKKRYFDQQEIDALSLYCAEKGIVK